MTSPKEMDKMLTVSDVARLLSVHINTVRRWSNQGILKTYRIGSRGDRRFHGEDIDTFLLQRSKIAELDAEGEDLPLLDLALEGSKNLLTTAHKNII